MEPLRVLIVDDHLLFRDGLRALLESATDLELSGEAMTGEEAIEQAASLLPDVIIMDIQMPGMNGIEATRLITQASPHIGIHLPHETGVNGSGRVSLRLGGLLSSRSLPIPLRVRASKSGQLRLDVLKAGQYHHRTLLYAAHLLL